MNIISVALLPILMSLPFILGKLEAIFGVVIYEFIWFCWPLFKYMCQNICAYEKRKKEFTENLIQCNLPRNFQT